MKLYLVRHGETLFNKLKRMQGWCDSPLSDFGIDQAKSLNKTLFDVPFAKAYCSTSERTRDTANLILKDRGINLIELKGLKEFNFGILEGEKEENVFKNDIVKSPFMDFSKYGGETMESLTNRFLKTLNDIILNNKEDDILLIVSHGGIITSGLYKLFPEFMTEQFKNENYPKNCSIHILDYSNNKFALEQYNLTDY